MVNQNDRASDEGSDSYIKDSIFPSGYTKHLQPALLSYVAATNEFAPPRPDTAFAYVELGCGIGATLNILAAANPDSRFIGVDFNPNHIQHARDDAHKNNLRNVTYLESSLSDISPAELPECDYVSIHGTYSWLPPSEQEGVHNVVRENLRSGGLFFIDYLSAPGRIPIDPLWVFLREVTRSSDGTSEQRVAEGMQILDRLGKAAVGYIENTPSAKAVLARNLRRIDNRSVNVLSHLAHHALAVNQEPNYFHEIQGRLHRFGLQFAGSTNTTRNDPSLCLSGDALAIYSEQDDLNSRELIKDFVLNDNHRKDVFIKSEHQDKEAAQAYLRERLFLHAMLPGKVVLNKWQREFENWRAQNKPDLAAALVLDCIDQGRSGFGEIELAGAEHGISLEELVRAINLLLHRNDIKICRKAPRQSSNAVHVVTRSPALFNMASRKARLVVASPVLGGGLVIGEGMGELLERSSGENGEYDDEKTLPGTNDDTQKTERTRNRESRLLSRLAQLEVLE